MVPFNTNIAPNMSLKSLINITKTYTIALQNIFYKFIYIKLNLYSKMLVKIALLTRFRGHFRSSPDIYGRVYM